MVFPMLDSLYITFSLLLLKLYTVYGPFMTSLVFCLHCFSPFITLRLGLFLALSLCFFPYNLIGSHHVTKISFLDSYYNAFFLSMFVYTHMTHLYVVFLQCETNLEGNIKGAPSNTIFNIILNTLYNITTLILETLEAHKPYSTRLEVPIFFYSPWMLIRLG